MNIGMLWRIDNPKTPFVDEVTKAADYFNKKYRKIANLCVVHPSMLPTNGVELLEIDGVSIQSDRSILPGHLWIGVEEKVTE